MANNGRSGEANRDANVGLRAIARGTQIMRNDDSTDYTENQLQYNRASRDEDNDTAQGLPSHNSARDYRDNSNLPGYGR